jgi:hypothetical protein
MSSARKLSLAQQATALRSSFPGSKTDLRPKSLTWTGTIRPTPCSRDYRVKIVYEPGSYPRVTVLDPLTTGPDTHLPHTYRDDSLCLHAASDWNSTMAIADSIIPWTADWLAHYELWRHRSQWHGDDTSTEENPDSSSGADTNRAARRLRARQRPPKETDAATAETNS